MRHAKELRQYFRFSCLGVRKDFVQVDALLLTHLSVYTPALCT